MMLNQIAIRFAPFLREYITDISPSCRPVNRAASRSRQEYGQISKISRALWGRRLNDEPR